MKRSSRRLRADASSIITAQAGWQQLAAASALVKLFPGRFEIDLAARLFGSTAGLDRLKAGDDPAVVASSWGAAEARWRLLRAKYLLY